MMILEYYREELWATFPRQDEAMKFVKGHHCAHVFSYQDHMNGQRRFLVSTYEEFWQRCLSYFVSHDYFYLITACLF